MIRRFGPMLMAIAILCPAFGAPVAVAHQGHSWGEPPPDRKCGSACRADLERARLASAKYRDIVVALADGFVPVSPCEEGQGVHLLNLARFDAALSVTEPELLLYLPDSAGRLRLVGIEHAKPDDDGDLSTDHDRPTLYGRPFNGPMLGHDPLHATPAHYDLHVWLWSDHPTGIFAQHNPALSCPGAGIAPALRHRHPDSGWLREILGSYATRAPPLSVRLDSTRNDDQSGEGDLRHGWQRHPGPSGVRRCPLTRGGGVARGETMLRRPR